MNDFNAQLQALSQRVMQHSVIQEDKTEYNKTLPSENIEKEVVLYQTDDGNVNVSVLFNDETFWLTQKTMGELFGVASNTITYHLQEIFKSGELEKVAFIITSCFFGCCAPKYINAKLFTVYVPFAAIDTLNVSG